MAYNAGASSGNLVLIQATTAATQASVEFKTNVTGFDHYIIYATNITFGTDGDFLLMQLSTDAGGTYINAGYQRSDMLNVSGSGIGVFNDGNAQTTIFFNTSPTTNAANYSYNTEINLYSLGTALYKHVFAETSYFQQATFFTIREDTSSTLANTSVVNACKFYCNSGGNIVAGTFKLFGVQN